MEQKEREGWSPGLRVIALLPPSRAHARWQVAGAHRLQSRGRLTIECPGWVHHHVIPNSSPDALHPMGNLALTGMKTGDRVVKEDCDYGGSLNCMEGGFVGRSRFSRHAIHVLIGFFRNALSRSRLVRASDPICPCVDQGSSVELLGQTAAVVPPAIWIRAVWVVVRSAHPIFTQKDDGLFVMVNKHDRVHNTLKHR